MSGAAFLDLATSVAFVLLGLAAVFIARDDLRKGVA